MSESEEFEGGAVTDLLVDPIGVLQRRWRWMVGVFVVGTALTSLYVAGLKPRYEASATVLITSQDIPEDFVRPTVQEDALEKINALMGTVLSNEAMIELIEKHDLYPDLRGKLEPNELVPLVRSDISVSEERRGPRSRNESARLFRIRFTADEPGAAAAIANAIARRFTTESIRMRTQRAHLATEFLRTELGEVEAKLRAQQREITIFKERYRGELPSELQANLSKLERLQQQRQSLALQIAEAESRYTKLASELAVGTSEGGDDLHSLRAQLARARTSLTESHPDVLALQEQVEALEAQLGSLEDAGGVAPPTGPALLASSRLTLDTLRDQLAATEASLSDLDARVGRIPARQEELAALEDRASVLRDSYFEFLEKVQDAELAETLESAQQGERFSIVDRAHPPRTPLRTRIKYLIAGVMVSFASALAMGAVLELLDPVLVTASQLESECGLPTLGSVQRIS